MQRERGFTLIELMIVVLIIAILVAIAVPTFLGQRTRAQDRAAQAHIRTGLLVQKTYYSQEQVFTDDLDILKGQEPSLFKRNDVDDANDLVFAKLFDTQVVCLSAPSKSGHWFAIHEAAPNRTEYGNGVADPFGGGCPAGAPAGFDPDSDTGWDH